MSLIIHTIVPDGIVVSADTRITCKDKDGNVRYDDTAEKIIPFPNKIVVSHCGDAKIRDELTVIEFLYDIRKKYGTKATITDLPLRLLNEYNRANGCNDSVFKISGFIDSMFFSGCTYTVATKEKTVNLSIKPYVYGASYAGITEIAHAIMASGIDYNNLSISDAIDLTRGCVQENIDVFKYHPAQSIGGTCQTYVIDTLHHKTGWLQDNGNLLPDENAPDDACAKYQEQYFLRMQKEIEKELANKKNSKRGKK